MWVGRLRNIAADDLLQGSDRLIRIVLSGTFVALALIVVVGLLVNRKQATLPTWLSVTATSLAVYGIVTWVIRGIDITFGDHSAAFKVVHAVLAVVTISLSVLALRFLRSVNHSWRKPSDARISA